MKPTIFFLMNSIDLMRGGLTRASLKQASFFAEMGYETQMLTFNFNPAYPIIRHKLLEMNKVHKNVKIRNMYEELEGHDQPLINTTPPVKASIKELAEGNAYDKRKNRNAYRVYKNGAYYKYISLREQGSLHFIDYYNENRYRTKRVTYDLWGNIKRVAYMDLLHNKPRQLIYYDENEKAYLTQWNNPETDEVLRIIIFDKDTSIKKQYINETESHKIDWLTQVINEEGKQSIVISDTRSTDPVLIGFKHPQAAKVWRLHSNHVTVPYEVDSDISEAVKPGFNHITEFDVAIFLTDEQKQDIIQRTNLKDNRFKVVPHYHETKKFLIKSLFQRVKPDEKLAVVVSRLSTLKRADHIIEAFKIVTKEIPDARLEIWGHGTQVRNLKKLINKLNLKKNVFLKGYTHDPDKVYEGALFSVLTSKTEGFALSVLESMYNKTPVISYNIRYGPSDMIVHNENGMLVENGHIEELAESMIWMFKNPKQTITMGKEARKYIDEHFSKKVYEDQWMEVIDLAMKNKFG